MYGGGAGATRVEVQREETDGEMERFARYFVSVDERAPVPVYRDQTKRARRAAEVAPVGGDVWGGRGGGEMAVRNGLGGLFESRGCWRGFCISRGEGSWMVLIYEGFGTATSSSGALVRIRGVGFVFFGDGVGGSGSFGGGTSCWREVAVSGFGGVRDLGRGGNNLGGSRDLVLLRHGNQGLSGVECRKDRMPDQAEDIDAEMLRLQERVFARGKGWF